MTQHLGEVKIESSSLPLDIDNHHRSLDREAVKQDQMKERLFELEDRFKRRNEEHDCIERGIIEAHSET